MAMSETINFEEYSLLNGGHPINVKNRFLWPSGASAADDDSFRQSPPQNSWDLLQAQKKYWEARLEKSQDDFNNLKSGYESQINLSQRYSNLPGPPTYAPDRLREQKKIVHEALAGLKIVKEKIANSPRAAQAAEFAAVEEENRLAKQELANKIAGVTINDTVHY